MSNIKLHFESNLDYQQDAIAAAVDLFKGQESCRSEFTVVAEQKMQMELLEDATRENDLGVGNRLELLNDEVLDNLREIQFRHGIKDIAEVLESNNFTVEMETGTGKTYVYLRTIFELNKQYGFTKFMIVVPSVAIKEGVDATIRQTADHFLSLYPSAAGYNSFVYDSSRLNEVRNFATSDQIQIMVVTVGAINKKDVNNIYVEGEQTGGEKPIDLIRATNPILIVDEPQSVDGGMQGRGREALEAMNPLCTLRYSATHIDKFHQIYSLDSVQAYNKELVKQIEVAALEVEGDHNKAYLKLIKVEKGKRGAQPTARVEIDVQNGKSVKRQIVTVMAGDDLQQLTDRELYKECRIGQLKAGTKAKPGTMILSLPHSEVMISENEGINGLDGNAIARLMIARTIKEHLDKELLLRPQGIKVLSLFFVPSVDKYRLYDEEGNAHKGIFAQIFEEEYEKQIKNPEYNSLFKEIDTDTLAREVHDGYFAVDKKMHTPFEDMDLKGNKEEQATSSYNLIMKEKEKLLSFDTKLKFIFSHSALKEGWDNPNVFQICNLRDMHSERERRQTIGRGLRLCVNQEGQRVRGFQTNRLTVIANESYEKFADELQMEIERETGIKFGVVDTSQFSAIPVYNDETGKHEALGVEESKAIYKFLRENDYVDSRNKVTPKLKEDLDSGEFSLPDDISTRTKKVADKVKEVLVHLSSKIKIKNADEREQVKLNKQRFLDPSFKALWDKIKYKTTYRVEFDEAKLIDECSSGILDMPSVVKTRARFVKAELAIDEGGIGAEEKAQGRFENIADKQIPLPDILTDLEAKTKLTRKSLVDILVESRRLEDFKSNPQQFIEYASEAINRTKRQMLVDGITYKRVGDTEFYAQELLATEELTGYFQNMVPADKSIYEYVVCDSEGVEKGFAEDLEKNESVKVYVKLPGWFKVPTPLGTYNPDWAIVVTESGEDKLYLVIETKGSLWWDDLRHSEGGKIGCAKEHFKAIAIEANPAKYVKAKQLSDVI